MRRRDSNLRYEICGGLRGLDEGNYVLLQCFDVERASNRGDEDLGDDDSTEELAFEKKERTVAELYCGGSMEQEDEGNNDVVIDKVDTMDTTDTNLSLWDLTDKIGRRVWATRSQPSGDVIRKAIFGKTCPEEWCSDGFLSFHDQLQTLLYNNSRPIASTYEPFCPCCMAAEMVERYARERYLRATSNLNMDKLQEFLTKLRSRFAELGYIYSLRALGEIDWATSDATEDEEEDSDDDSVWEQVRDDEDDEGPDFQPAPAAAIAALTCKPYVKSAKGREDCAICQDDFNNGDAVVELPCGHVYCGSGSNCIVTWLKTSNSCPQCRARLLDAQT